MVRAREEWQQLMSDAVDEQTLHRVVHQLIEVCYLRARLRDATADFAVATDWRVIARVLTNAEALAMVLSL